MSSYVIVAVNTNKGNISLITKYPMEYNDAIRFMNKSNQERGAFPNTILTLAEVFK